MSKPSRLVRTSKQSRKAPPADRSRMLIVGERLMRAGSEGNLVRSRPAQEQRAPPSSTQEHDLNMFIFPDTVKSVQQPYPAEDEENLERKLYGTAESFRSDPWSPRTLPWRYAVEEESVSRDDPTMQSQRSERSREVFQEQTHHYHTSITSHPHRLTEQVSGNPQPWAGQQCEAPLLASLESVQAMSEEATSTFTRGSRTRASLPVVKSSNQTKDRSLGVLFLQYGDETRQILMPNELTSADTVRALFVSAFPQQLTLKMLESPSVAVYIKDHVRNVYYELTDIRNITAHSCLKVYHKDPAQAFNHSPLNGTADTRLPRYSARQQAGGQNMLHTLPPPHSPVRGLKGSLSPPSGRSVPPSPSRFPYGMALPAGATLPRERQSSVPGTRSAPPCTSAILERRDVKPDEDLGGRAAPLYADPYALAEARLSVASSQGTHASDAPDGQVFLQRRPHAKSLGSYAEVSEPQHSLYRQRSRKYSENPHVPLGSKTPPSSPQRVGEVRMIDVHPSQNAHMLAQGAERSLHARRSFRKDSNGTLEVVGRMRGTVASPVFVDLPHGHADRPFQGIIATAGPQGERMKAMEQQIASLTGLVQHALFKGTNTSGVKENGSEKVSEPLALGTTSGGVSPMAGSKSPVLQAHPLARAFPPGSGDPALGPLLCTFKRNVSNLRMELQQLRQTQVQNQEVVREMLQQTEVVLTERVGEQLRLLDDPVQKQRKQVEQERHRYVSMEEKLLLQLGELENHVERLKNDSAQQPIALRDVEEGAVTLRTVGETLAALKGEFPALQLKMRSVLRVEVEAVRFLKEEPHKMDATLKRVKALTDTLSSLRRCASEGHAFVDLPAPVNLTPAKESDPPDVWRDSPSPQPSTPARTELKPSSPVVVHQACSSPVSLQPSQQSVGLSLHPSPPLSPSSSEDSAALQENKGPAVQERVKSRGSLTSGLRRHDEIRSGKSEERVERAEEDVGAQMERKLRQAQTRLMESIPDLEVTQEESSSPPPATCLPDQANPSQPSPPLPDAATLAEPVADKPVQISAERGPNTHVEKPHLVKSSPETAIKSPPPPPPRRLHPSAPGVTTGRSGEVIYTARKEPPPVQQQEGEEEAPHAKPQRVPPEVKPKPHISPPVNTSSARGEDQGDRDRIAPDLQVFEKCPVKDLEPRYVVDLTTHELPDKELETNFSFSSFDPKNAPQHCSDGPQSPKTPKPGSGVIYYITGKSRSPSDTAPSGPGEQNHPSEGIISSLKNPSGASSLSRITSPKSRAQAGTVEKPAKPPKLQDSQRQFRQANGHATAARGVSKRAFLALPASKIPIFCPSCGNSSPGPNPSKGPSPSTPSHSSAPSSSKPARIPAPSGRRSRPLPLGSAPCRLFFPSLISAFFPSVSFLIVLLFLVPAFPASPLAIGPESGHPGPGHLLQTGARPLSVQQPARRDPSASRGPPGLSLPVPSHSPRVQYSVSAVVQTARCNSTPRLDLVVDMVLRNSFDLM